MSNKLPPPPNLVPHPPKVYRAVVEVKTQAARVFEKFGGVPNLQRALAAANPEKRWSLSAIYRWDAPKDLPGRKRGGSGGMIPTNAMPDVMAAARREGIVLTAEDLYPTAAQSSGAAQLRRVGGAMLAKCVCPTAEQLQRQSETRQERYVVGKVHMSPEGPRCSFGHALVRDNLQPTAAGLWQCSACARRREKAGAEK